MQWRDHGRQNTLTFDPAAGECPYRIVGRPRISGEKAIRNLPLSPGKRDLLTAERTHTLDAERLKAG